MNVDLLAAIGEILKWVVITVVPLVAVAAARAVATDLARWYYTQPEKQQRTIAAVVTMAVYAAEKLGENGWVQSKKGWALQMAQAQLAAYGINVDAALLDAQVEAAVMTYFRKWPPPAPPLVADTSAVDSGFPFSPTLAP